MPPLSIRTAQALPATQTIRPSQKHFVFHSSYANKHSQNDTVGKTTNNHEYAHLHFAINQKTTAKIKDTRKIQAVPPSIPYISDAPLNMVHLRTLVSKSLLCVCQLHQFSSGPVYTGKTLKFFGSTNGLI